MLSEAQKKCLEALNKEGRGGDHCLPFDPIQAATELNRKEVRQHVRTLADKGFARYCNGLMTEDGELAGAGYCITPAGRRALEESK
jgi:DNA-binding Lrp family transcriptional regulator